MTNHFKELFIQESNNAQYFIECTENPYYFQHPFSEALLNNWTSYEAFNIVLFEWTQALRSSGTSKNFQEMVFKLWVTYLQRMEVAFLPLEEKKSKKPKASIIENIR